MNWQFAVFAGVILSIPLICELYHWRKRRKRK
jgi:hypothetical protein